MASALRKWPRLPWPVERPQGEKVAAEKAGIIAAGIGDTRTEARAWTTAARAWPAPVCSNFQCPSRSRTWRRWFGKSPVTLLEGVPYCGSFCLDSALSSQLTRMLSGTREHTPSRSRLPLGLLLVARGLIRETQLQHALEAQRRSGKGRIGDWLEAMGWVTEDQITTLLGVQWSCPLFPLDTPPADSVLALLPGRLLRDCRMLPVYVSPTGNRLHVGFADGIAYPALYAVEHMLECRTDACLLKRSALERQMERLAETTQANESVFDSLCGTEEIMRITASYVRRMDSHAIRMVICGNFLWVRLASNRSPQDLLFRLPAPAQHAIARLATRPERLLSAPLKPAPSDSTLD